MVPATALARDAGLTVDGGIVVDPMQVTSNPAVLAVGDVARTCAGGVLLHRSEHWEAAQHDAQRAAATILGVPPPAAGASWFWTDRYGTHVEVVGNLAGADEFASRGRLGEQPYACFGLRGGRVVGAVAVNDSASVRAARRMIDRGITISAAELGDPSVDLRRLIKR
jgi:3-phenylpropionate/trans-cinnamate dioxygenase ferredoxin reductase component